MKTIRTIAAGAATIALAVGITIAANAGAPNRDTRQAHLEEPTSLYVFAEQPQGCTPGYISINHARGASWTVAGMPTAVTPPSTTIDLPGGFQDDVVATALPGYSIPASVQSEFFLTVHPIPRSCYPQPTTATPIPTPIPTPTTSPTTPTPTSPPASAPSATPTQPNDTATTPGPMSCEAR